MIATRPMLSAYRRMSSPLSASTPSAGLELDPLKRGGPQQDGGWNAQSAANANAAKFVGQFGTPPPPPPASAVKSAAPAAPPPVPPPTQPLAPVGGYARATQGGSWGPATANLTMAPQQAAVAVNQAPAQQAGSGAVSTKHSATTPVADPNARMFPGPGGQLLTRAEWEKYQTVLGQSGVPAAVDRATGGVPVIDPITGDAGVPRAAGAGTTPAAADAIQTGTAGTKSLYDDPLIKSLLAEVQGRIAGDTTTAQNRMNDRTQQQADVTRQEIDRRMAGRNLSATSPLRDKAYNDLQQGVNDQIALRDAEMDAKAQEQGRQLFDSVQTAKNADAYRASVAAQQRQYQQSLVQQQKQQSTDNILGLLAMIPQASGYISGFNSLKNLFTGGGGSSAPPPSGELGFRNQPPAAESLLNYIRGGR